MSVIIQIRNRDRGGHDSARRITLRRLKSSVAIAQQNADRAVPALGGTLTAVRHDQICFPVSIHVTRHNRVGLVSSRSVFLPSLKGSVPISQKHSYDASVASALRALIGHHQISFPVSIEVTNRNRIGIHSVGCVACWIEKNRTTVGNSESCGVSADASVKENRPG